MKYIFEDWTPLIREVVEAPEHLAGVEIPKAVLERYKEAKAEFLSAAADLEEYEEL